MPKKLDVQTEKHTIRLAVGDAATLGEFYPAVGYNAAIRTLVSRHCKALRERASREGAISNVGHAAIDAAAHLIDEQPLIGADLSA